MLGLVRNLKDFISVMNQYVIKTIIYCKILLFTFIPVAACIEEDGVMSSFTPTSPSTLHNFDVNITYTCATGYNHSSGDLFRTCQNNGQWTGTAPTCTSKAYNVHILLLVICTTSP